MTSKVKFSQSRKKKRHFGKGLVHGFCQKIDLFLICLFLAKKARKKHFLIFWTENKAFWTLKVRFSNSRKKSTFCKGVSPWFCQNINLFVIPFFLTKKSQRETFFVILDRKECFLDLKSEDLKNSKQSTFCKGVTPWFFSKNRPFLHPFF